MSIFSNKLRSFLGNNWHNTNDINVNNNLIKERTNMLAEEEQAQEYLSNFIINNKEVLNNCSNEFNEKLKELTNYITESKKFINKILESQYDGIWEETSLSIKDKIGRNLRPEIIDKIKSMLLTDYSVNCIEDPKKPKEIILVPTIPIIKIVSVEHSVKRIDKNLKVTAIYLPEMDFNKAEEINKKNKENILPKEEWVDEDSLIEENKNKNKIMENKNINNLFKNVEKRLISESLAYEKNGLYNFISKNYDKVKKICENNSSIDTYRLYALMEAQDLKEDNTTADMSVPNLPITSSVIRKRLENFDPYGKNLSNTYGKNNKSVINFDANTLKESLKSKNIDKMTILVTDIETTNKYSRIIVESENKRNEFVIDKNNFLKFVSRNGDTREYMEEGKLNFEKYSKSRTNAFMGIIIKEYFKNIIKESFENPNDFIIEDYDINPNDLTIYCSYNNDDENSKEVFINRDEFEDWLQTEFYEMINTGNFNLDDFFNNFSFPQAINIIKEFMNIKGLGKINENKKLKESKYSDYNEWKDNVATVSNNNFEIKRKSNNNLLTQALNNKGKIIGEWDPAKTLGTIFK